MAARGGAGLPVRDGQRRAVPAVHDVVRAIAEELARRAHRRRPGDGLARATRHRARRWSRARAEHALGDGPRAPCATPRSATATARSRASAARRSPRERLERGQARAAHEWVVLFEDVTPLGSHRLEMHVAHRPGAARLEPEPTLDAAARRRSSSRSSSSTRRRRVAARPAAADAGADATTPTRSGRRASTQARATFGEGADMTTPPQADHRRALPHRRDPAVEVLRPRAPGQADGLRLPRDPNEFVKNHMDEFKIERALTMSNYGVPVHEISFDLNDVVMEAATTQRPHPRGDLGLVPAAQRGDDAQGARSSPASRASWR